MNPWMGKDYLDGINKSNQKDYGGEHGKRKRPQNAGADHLETEEFHFENFKPYDEPVFTAPEFEEIEIPPEDEPGPFPPDDRRPDTPFPPDEEELTLLVCNRTLDVQEIPVTGNSLVTCEVDFEGNRIFDLVAQGAIGEMSWQQLDGGIVSVKELSNVSLRVTVDTSEPGEEYYTFAGFDECGRKFGGFSTGQIWVGPSAVFKHWRLYITAVNDGGNFVVAELEFMDQVSGSDIVPTLSGSPPGHWTIFDDNINTVFSRPPPRGLDYTFDSGKEIVQYTITPNNQIPTRAPKDWILQKSTDGIEWADVHTVTGQTGWGISEKRTFTV